MYRMLYSLDDMLIGVFILIPLFIIYNKVFFHNIKKTFIYFIFSCYLIVVWVLVGMPDIIYYTMDFSYNFIPFLGMFGDISQSLLNVLLFIPLGVLLPFINDKYKIFRNTFIFGLCSTISIELLQIFTYRATDINDVITNTIGTVIGYIIIKIFIRNCKSNNYTNKVSVIKIIYLTIFVVMFLICPLIYDLLY